MIQFDSLLFLCLRLHRLFLRFPDWSGTLIPSFAYCYNPSISGRIPRRGSWCFTWYFWPASMIPKLPFSYCTPGQLAPNGWTSDCRGMAWSRLWGHSSSTFLIASKRYTARMPAGGYCYLHHSGSSCYTWLDTPRAPPLRRKLQRARPSSRNSNRGSPFCWGMTPDYQEQPSPLPSAAASIRRQAYDGASWQKAQQAVPWSSSMIYQSLLSSPFQALGDCLMYICLYFVNLRTLKNLVFPCLLILLFAFLYITKLIK